MPAAKLPLFKHRNGQWAKKIKGKLYYFGTQYEVALESYLRDADHLKAGKGKPQRSGTPTIVELANLYYDGCRGRVSSGDLTQATLDEAERSLKRLVEFRGISDHPSDWEPLDFKDIKLWLFEPVVRTTPIRGGIKQGNSVKRRSSITVDGDIRRIKAFLNWCKDARLIGPPDYGQEFSQSSKKQQRIAKTRAGKRTFDVPTLKAIIAETKPVFLPVLLLGINAGMGARDIAALTVDQVSGAEWLDCPRQKTGVARRVWLWPETRKAIKHYLTKLRRDPWSKAHTEIAFHTSHRQPWIRDTQDAASQAFTKARREAGLDSGTFYDLRRTFQTIGDETLDFPAVKFCMGHVASANDMSAKYREVSDERIKRVCSYVRTWLYGK